MLLPSWKGGGWDGVDWSAGRQATLLIEGISVTKVTLIFDAQTGATKEVMRDLRRRRKDFPMRPRYFQGRKGIFVTTDREIGIPALAYIDLASGKHSYLIPDAKFDVDGWT